MADALPDTPFGISEEAYSAFLGRIDAAIKDLNLGPTPVVAILSAVSLHYLQQVELVGVREKILDTCCKMWGQALAREIVAAQEANPGEAVMNKPRHILIADMIRLDQFSKEMIIGAYCEKIVAFQMPCILMPLAFRIEFVSEPESPQQDCEFEMLSPSGASMLRIPFKTPPSRGRVWPFHIHLRAVEIKEIGDHALIVRVFAPDSEQRVIQAALHEPLTVMYQAPGAQEAVKAMVANDQPEKVS